MCAICWWSVSSTQKERWGEQKGPNPPNHIYFTRWLPFSCTVHGRRRSKSNGSTDFAQCIATSGGRPGSVHLSCGPTSGSLITPKLRPRALPLNGLNRHTHTRSKKAIYLVWMVCEDRLKIMAHRGVAFKVLFLSLSDFKIGVNVLSVK